MVIKSKTTTTTPIAHSAIGMIFSYTAGMHKMI
jgi:hypothetical protein